mgnify:CR=1 FL=1
MCVWHVVFSFKDLANRIEAPDGNARWDKPLFTVGPEDPLPFQDILQVVQGQGFRAHCSNATAHGRLEDTTFRYQLDQKTSAVVNAVMAAMGEGFVPGDRVRIPDCKTEVCTTQDLLACGVTPLSPWDVLNATMWGVFIFFPDPVAESCVSC